MSEASKEATVEGLRAELEEKDDLLRLLRSNLALADQATAFERLVSKAERLLRSSSDREVARLKRDLSARMNRRTVSGLGRERIEMLTERLRESAVMGARRWFFECFPELDIRSDGSIPRLAVEELQKLSSRAEQLLHRPPRRVTLSVVLLRPPVEDPKGPRFLSYSTVVEEPRPQDRANSTHRIDIPYHWRLEAGTWIVAHGGTFRNLYLGTYSLDTGPEHSFSLLQEEVPLGVSLRAEMSPSV